MYNLTNKQLQYMICYYEENMATLDDAQLIAYSNAVAEVTRRLTIEGV